MDFCIEDGYNTDYICVSLLALLFEHSMIERVLLLENNRTDNNLTSTYLQQLIKHNFIEHVRDNISITSEILNEIRLYSHLLGWGKYNLFNKYEPIDYITFLIKQVGYIPVETNNNKHYVINLESITDNDIQTTYNHWADTNTIINIPVFVIFKIKLSEQLNLNKKIKLFNEQHQYHMIKWVFHSLFYQNNAEYHTIIHKGNELFKINLNHVPTLTKIEYNNISNVKNKDIYIIYRKEPII